MYMGMFVAPGNSLRFLVLMKFRFLPGATRVCATMFSKSIPLFMDSSPFMMAPKISSRLAMLASSIIVRRSPVSTKYIFMLDLSSN